MQKQSLGRMKNAPLALVLAQVRFSPYLTLESRVPSLQDALRRDYPAFRKQQFQTMEVNPAGVAVKLAVRWEFTDLENSRGFLVTQDSVVFQATAYEDYDDFSGRLAVALTKFEETVSDVLVERLGLRYVDLIVPAPGERPEDYVAEGLRGFPSDQFDSAHVEAQYVAKLDFPGDGGSLVARYVRGISGPFVPGDLQPLTLIEPAILKRARDREGDAPIALLDWDRIVPHRAPFQVKELMEHFSQMHADVGVAFKKTLSAHAEQIWTSAQ